MRQVKPFSFKHVLVLFLCYCIVLQPNTAFAGPVGLSRATQPASANNSETPSGLAGSSWGLFDHVLSFFDSSEAAPAVFAPVDAAVSRKAPNLSNGRVEGNLRVYTGQPFSFEGGFVVTNETYVVGTPNVTVATNATFNAGTIDESGSPDPAGYTIAINGTSRLVGKIHRRSDPLAFPADIPASVPQPTGTRIVNINTAADLANIGDWSTLKELHVNKSNETITVPAGNYGSFSVTGSSRLNFNGGVYNFSDGFSFASNATIKVTGQTTINIGSSATLSNTGLLFGENTLPGDIKLHVLGSTLTINGNSTIKALMRVPNGTASLTGSCQVRGQVIADRLEILTNAQIIGDTSSNATGDTTPPNVTITSPANNATINNSSVTVTGTAVDPGVGASGVSSVLVNNIAATYNPNNQTWSANVSLNFGTNTIIVRATDGAGNTSPDQQIVVVRPQDTTPPALTITSPANNSSTESSSITVSGTVSDTGANATGVAQVTVNGAPATINPQDGTWTIANVSLPNAGGNEITAVATDNAGNTSQPVTITVNRQNPQDTTAPTISITSPSNNTQTPNASITVTGTANDEGANATGVSRVIVNGQQANYNPQNHQWTIDVSLSEGPNTIDAYAEDNASPANRSTTATVNVTRRTPDTTPPTVTITSPLTSFDTYDTTVNLAGTAQDSGLNATGVQSVTVNGTPAVYNPATHQWSLASFALAFGPNHIVVTAVDGGTPANQNQAEVTITRRQLEPPSLTITNPLNGAVVNSSSITVAGSVSSDLPNSLAVTVNGANTPITGGQFARTLQLTEGSNPISVVATDAQGQQTQLSITVRRDSTAPQISFVNVPASVQPGGTYQVLVNATDNEGIADVELRLNGQKIETITTAPYQFTLAIPAVFTSGVTLVLSAVARDLTNTTSVATAQLQTAGPGGISGYVFDDTTGYVMDGVNALLNGSSSVTTDEQGIFSFVSSAPVGVVRLSRDGYTPVERLYKVAIGEGTALFDARLTPLDSQTNSIGPSGGTVNGDGGRVQVSFVAGALSQQMDLRVTSVSPQGLANLLPFGWSPVPGAIIDLRATSGPLAESPAHLTISQVTSLVSGAPATPVTFVRYDEATHLWSVVAVGLVASVGGALAADLPGLGQYAFLVPDTGATAPPTPVVGQPLPSSQAADSVALDSAQATAVSSPRSAAFSPIAKSSISFLATAASQLPSGVSIEASFGETYNLLGGKDEVLVDRPAQDFVLYAYPAATGEQSTRLGAFFIAKPTRTNYSITEIFNANVHVEIRSGRQNKLGVLIGNQGGSVRAGDGSQFLIPENAVSGQQSAFFDNVQVQSAGVTLPAGYEVLAAFDVDLGSASLNSSGTISVPGLTGDLSRVVVAQLITVGGQRSPKVVARAVVDANDRLSSTTATPPAPAGIALRGIRSTGRYVFIRVPSDFGYVKGTITDAATNAPQTMIRVSTNQAPFVDVTGNDGQYLLVGTAGPATTGVNQIGAAALSTDATGTASASLEAQDAVANANIALSAVALQVESITPASGAQNMIATTPVTITFNKPIAAQTLTGSSFTLSTSAGNPVLGTITVLAGSRVVVFTPAATLAASTTYRVALTTAVRDIYGHALGAAFNSTFTTAATVVIGNRLKPEQITISHPDVNGNSTVSIPAGSVPDGSTILVVNNTSGSTISTVAGTAALNLQIQAVVGDEIALTISQPDGTQYRVVQAAYRRADGFVSVGANGGTVTSDNGQVLLSVPAGAIQGQADLKLSTFAESAITIPRQGDMDPANVPFGAGIRITTSGNFTNTQELHLEVAAPATATEGQRVFFMKPAKLTEAGGERDVWEVVTSGKVEGGKFKTMSPPFIGVTIASNLGFYDVAVFMPRTFRAVTGTVTEKVNSGGTKPLANVTVFITGVSGNETRTVMARTAANGQFGTLDPVVSSADSVIIEATDTLGRKKTAVATPFLSFSPAQYPGLNGLSSMFTSIVFPSSEGLPETLPALLRTEGRMLDLAVGQVDTLQAFGRVAVGSHVQVTVRATPDVKTITGKLMVSGATRRELIWRNPNPGSSSYETDFTLDGEGAYTVAVTTYTQANVESTKATTNFSFIGLSNPNTRPSIPGAPFVLSVTPRDQAQQVDSGTRVHLEFSEPVKNLVAGTSVYLTEQGSSTPLGGSILSGGIPVGPSTPNISSIDFIPSRGLQGGKTYTVHVTTGVLDSEDEHLDQSPDDLELKPFTSTFNTFQGLVLTTEPPPDTSFRIAAAGDLAATVTTDFSTSSGSTLTIYDMSDPQHPDPVSRTFVPQRAIGIAMMEIAPEDTFAVNNPPSTIVVVTTISHPDIQRANNLWVYSVDNPEKPERIGAVSLSFPSRILEFPANLTLNHKRAYIGNTGTGGVLVVDLEAAIRKYQEVGAAAATLAAVLPNQGFNNEAQRQRAKYGNSQAESAPVMAVSVIDQITVPNQPAEPVAYVASNRPQLISFRLGEEFDGRLNFHDSPPFNGFDDRVLTMVDLNPAGFAIDLRAVPNVLVGGTEKDLTLMLGQTRLWIYDVTNPAAPQYLSSPLFTDLGGPNDYARRIEVEGTLAYVMFSDSVLVIDFHDPANPILSSTITGIGTNLRWITVKDGFVYTLSGEGRLNVSIGRAASLVLIHGHDANATQTCGNPVVIDRQTRRMAQSAEVFFQVFGHDAPQSAKVIIRKTTIAGNQSQDTTLATLPVNLQAAIPNVVVGSAIWPPIADPIDPAATYTAEVVLDENGSNEFHSRREAIPFSFLIDQYQQSFGITSGMAQFSYLLGGDAKIDFRIDNREVLTTEGDTRARNFGANQERTSTTELPGTMVFNPPLATGTYPFTLRATLNANPSVFDEVQGFVTVDSNRYDARLPGSTVVNGVEVSTGNLGLSVNDLEIRNRGLSLSVTRSYNTAGRNSFNPMGYGWRHNYQILLQHFPGQNGLPGSFMLIGGEGGGQVFNEAQLQANGRVSAESPYQGTLVRVADGFDYLTKGRVKYHFAQAMDAGTSAFFDFGYMGNLSYIEEPNGNRISLSYDAEGRMVRATDSSGRSLNYQYELAETPLVGSIDVVLNSTSCQSKARLGIMRRRFLQAQVGKAWHITKITGPGGVEIEYEYDPTIGNLTSVRRRSGDDISQPAPQDYVWSYEYNPTTQANPLHDHLLKSVTSPNSAVAAGHKTIYEYRLDQFGQPVGSIQMPEGVTNTFTYTFGPSGNQITQAVVTDGLQQSRTYQLERGRVTRILEPRGAQTVLAWNDKGNKTLEIDPEGRQTATHYDSNGNPDSQTVTGGNQTITVSSVFDPTFNKPISVTDGNRKTTTYSLDARGNVTRVLLPNGRDIRMDYAANGDLQRMVDQYGFATTYQYDVYGNAASVTRQTGQLPVVDQQTFDVRSRLLTSQGTIAPSVTNTYDALDRVISQTVTDPTGIRDSLAMASTYLPEGQVASVSQTGGTQSFNKLITYDGLNRLIRVVESPNGAGPFTLNYTYDRNSNLITETDRRGVTITRTYDELNFVTSETLSGSFGPTLSAMTATEIDRVGNPVRVKNLFNQETSYEYDGLHRLTKRNVPGGFTEETSYDANGNVVAERDRNGRETTMTYDPLNRPATMRDPAGRITTWTYDDATNTTTIQRDPQGLTERMQSDGLGRLVQHQLKFGSKDYLTINSYNGRTVQTTDPRGTISVRQLSSFGEPGQLTVNGAAPAYSEQMAYGPFGGLRRSVDANGRATTYSLDGLNRATQISRPGSFSESFSYDGAGNVLSYTDLRGTVSQKTYDNLGRPLVTTVQNDNQPLAVLTIAYQDALSKETRTDAKGNITQLEFDGLHRLKVLTNADNKPRSLHYDGMNLLQESDFKGINTSYVYDAVDRVTQITDRLGQITNIANSDSGGYQKTVTDRRGNQRVEVYDPLQRLLSVNQGGASLVTYEYDENSNRIATIDGRNNRITYSYDKLNRLTAVNHPGNPQAKTFAYDAVGNVLNYNDGAGGDVVQTYDEINHLKTRDDGAGNVTKFKYDGGGLLLEKTDPKGGQYKTTYTYNALGSLQQVNDANGGEWRFEYDPAQNLQSIRDALGRTVAYGYDSLNRLQTVTQPLDLITTYGYDANSNRVSVNDPKGHITSFGYDALDRVQSVNYTNVTGAGPRSYSYGYDPEGNVTSVNETTMLDGSSTVTRNYQRSYDARNRLTRSTDPFNHTIRLDYDAANNLSLLADAETKETRYGYDALNRLQTVTLPNQAGTINYQWQPDGLLKQIAYPAGMRRDYTYDAADRLTNVNNHISATESDEFSYTYDANANRTTETRRQNGQINRSITYDYDLLDRLIAANYTSPGQRPANPAAGQSASYTESNRSTDFGFDKVGNRTTSKVQDRVTTVTLTTDANGVTTESRQNADQPLVTTTAQFNELNRLVQLSSDAAGSVATTYDYDRNGNLTSASQNQVTASYEYDCRDQLRKVLNGAGQELSAYDYNFDRQRIGKTAGGVFQSYVYAGDQVVNEYSQNNQLLSRYDLGAGDVVRGELNGEGERYYFSDGQGSITSLARTQGSAAVLTARYEYDAWGQYLGAAGASFNTIGYTGQRADSETGLMPLGNGERYYSPAVGSFIQQDSFTGVPSVTASLNRYSYVHDNPVKHTDPSGHVIPLLVVGAVLIAAVAIGTGTHRAHAEHNLEGDLQGWAHDDPRRSVRSAFGDGTGMTKIVNWATQQDVYTGRDLSLSEARWQGAFGVVEVVGNATAIGGAVFKGGSVALNIARGSEEGIQAVSGFSRSLSFKPAGADLRAVGSALRHPIQTGKAVASSISESYSAIGGARGALKEAWSFTRQEALPRLNPRNYSVELEGWSNVNINFGSGSTRSLSAAGAVDDAKFISASADGNPTAIYSGYGNLTARQQRILDLLPGYDSRAIVPKRLINQMDLAALTAKTGDEFAMFTTGGRRLLVRGGPLNVPVDTVEGAALAKRGWRWSAHTHPGPTDAVLPSSVGDRAVLSSMGGSRSAIFNSVGRRGLFNENADLLSGWLPR